MPSILSTLWPERLPEITFPFDFSGNTLALLALAATPLITVLFKSPALLRSYRTFIAIGPGGLPHNALGFLIQTALSFIARTDTRAVPPPYYHTPSPYQEPSTTTTTTTAGTTTATATINLTSTTAAPTPTIKPSTAALYAPLGQTSFLSLLQPQEAGNTATDTLPPRSGSRPDVPDLVVPQRQITERGGADVVRRMERFLVGLAGVNGAAAGDGKGQEGGLLEMRPSGLEGKWHQALFLRPSDPEKKWSGKEGDDDKGEEKDGIVRIPTFMGGVGGEIAHVHAEGSSHVTLSLVDAEEAVAKGWAERHRLSGVRNILPWSYIMVYAPRNDDEFAVWQRLVVAGCRFVSGGRAIKVPSEVA